MPYESDPITAKLNDLVCDQKLYFGLFDFEQMSLAEQALIGTWELANEIYNGGFMQYFHNSSGEHAKSMIDVLRSIDAPKAADIVEQARALAGPGTPWGDELDYSKAVKMAPADVTARLNALEDAFFDQSDDLHLRVFRYLSAHRDQIEAPAEFWTEATIQ